MIISAIPEVSRFSSFISSNPKEIDSYIFGNSGTDSIALYDHKAFLFDKEKELLVVPISLYEIDEETKNYYYEEKYT